MFLGNGAAGLTSFLVFALTPVLPKPALILGWAGLAVSNITFPAATLLTAVVMRRADICNATTEQTQSTPPAGIQPQESTAR